MGHVRFGRRKGGVSSTVLALFSGCVLIGFCLVLTVKTPDFFGLDLFQPNPNFGSVEQVANEQQEEPVENSDPDSSSSVDVARNIPSVNEAKQELESRGCVVSIVESLEGFSDEGALLLNYTEFKKIALKEEIVFQYTIQDQSMLIIPYEGTFIVWQPENESTNVQYTQFEKVEIQTAYSTKTTGSGWLVTMNLKNSGTSAAKLTHLFINDVPLNSTAYSIATFPDGTGDQVVTDLTSGGQVIGSGESQTVIIWIWNDGTNGYSTLSSGTTINIKLHSAGGMDYIKLVELV